MNIKTFVPCGKIISDFNKLHYECKNGFIIKEGTATKCECRKKYEEEVRFQVALENANLICDSTPQEQIEKLSSYSFSDYVGEDKNKNIEKLEKFVEKFDEKFSTINLFFQGDNGTQKSTVAKGICSMLMKKNKTVHYILGKDLITCLMDCERDYEKRKFIDDLLSVDLLVIDEISPDKLALYSSNYKQEQLTPFLKTRIEIVRKSVIFISNVMIDDFSGSKLGETLSDLIKRECCKGIFTFEDKYTEYHDFSEELKDLWS